MKEDKYALPGTITNIKTYSFQIHPDQISLKVIPDIYYITYL